MHTGFDQLIKATAAGRTFQLKENHLAVQVLRHIQPQLLDELPMLAADPAQPFGLASRTFWAQTLGVVVNAKYFGRGCPPNDNGWFLSFHPCHSREEFDRLAMNHQIATEQMRASLNPPT
jgi:hypothetical protein